MARTVAPATRGGELVQFLVDEGGQLLGGAFPACSELAKQPSHFSWTTGHQKPLQVLHHCTRMADRKSKAKGNRQESKGKSAARWLVAESLLVFKGPLHDCRCAVFRRQATSSGL